MRTALIIISLAILAAVATPAGAATPPRWLPPRGATMDWQYTGSRALDAQVTILNLDGEETSRSTISTIHKSGRRAVCYFSAGSYENYRGDRHRFPRRLLGRTMDGWPDERWLDIRAIRTLRPIMRSRMRMCAAKGFDAVDPDNVAGYTNRTGFPLTARHQLQYNRMIAQEAHRLGLAVGLKNDPDQAKALAPSFDFAVTEQCFEFNECRKYTPFIRSGKPVFNIEYQRTPKAFCAHTTNLGIFSVQKRLKLDAWRRTCS